MTLSRTLSPALILCLCAGVTHAQDLAAHERNLVEAAKKALAAPTFEGRNRIHAEAVTAESAALAARAVGANARSRALLERAFRSATLQAGEAFAPAFQGDEAAKKAAPNAAGGIAYNHVAAAFAALEGRATPGAHDLQRASSLIERVRIEDVQRMVAQDLGLRGSLPSGQALMGDIERAVPKNDWFRSELPNIPRQAAGEKPLTPAELKALRIASRMANAAWKSGQVHRAVLDNNPGRVDPKSAGNYTTFDGMQREIYRRAFESARNSAISQAEDRVAGPLSDKFTESIRKFAQDRALARTTLEVYKDVNELRMAREKSTPADAIATRKRLQGAYADELSRKTVPELIAEARAAGVDLRKSKSRLSKKAIVSKLSGLSRVALSARAKGQRTSSVSAKATPRSGASGRLADMVPGRSSRRPVRGR